MNMNRTKVKLDKPIGDIEVKQYEKTNLEVASAAGGGDHAASTARSAAAPNPPNP